MRFKKDGFTVVEYLVSISIFLLLFGIVVSSFRSYRETISLRGATELTLSVLSDARTRTLASEADGTYGVHVSRGTLILFNGNTYAGSQAISEVPLPQDVEVSSTILEGGGSDIIFERLSGSTASYGTVTLKHVQDQSKVRVIRIERSGSLRVE